MRFLISVIIHILCPIFTILVVGATAIDQWLEGGEEPTTLSRMAGACAIWAFAYLTSYILSERAETRWRMAIHRIYALLSERRIRIVGPSGREYRIQGGNYYAGLVQGLTIAQAEIENATGIRCGLSTDTHSVPHIGKAWSNWKDKRQAEFEGGEPTITEAFRKHEFNRAIKEAEEITKGRVEREK